MNSKTEKPVQNKSSELKTSHTKPSSKGAFALIAALAAALAAFGAWIVSKTKDIRSGR